MNVFVRSACDLNPIAIREFMLFTLNIAGHYQVKLLVEKLIFTPLVLMSLLHHLHVSHVSIISRNVMLVLHGQGVRKEVGIIEQVCIIVATSVIFVYSYTINSAFFTLFTRNFQR